MVHIKKMFLKIQLFILNNSIHTEKLKETVLHDHLKVNCKHFIKYLSMVFFFFGLAVQHAAS